MNDRVPALEWRQHDDPDGSVRLTLLGEVDIAVAEELIELLRRLARPGAPVRLDLSELAFIDAAGMWAILSAMAAARRVGAEIAVEAAVSRPVGRAVELAGLSRAFWPRAPRGGRWPGRGGGRHPRPSTG